MSEVAQQAVESKPSPVGPAAAEARRVFALALDRQQTGDLQGAIEAYYRLIDLFPTLADAYNNLAVLLKSAKQLPAAIACLRRAVIYAPTSAALHSNLGNMLWMALEFEEAMAEFCRALALDPTRHETYHNMGLLNFSLGKFEAAIECYDRALSLKPDARLVQWDRALALLASGDLARGFAAYDVRFELNDTSLGFDRKLQAVRSIPMPMWNGEDLAGRTLYIYAEQGLGDTIQFCRFLPELAHRGARVIFDCPPDLQTLMESVPSIAELRPEGSSLPVADFHLPLLSIPHRLGITLETIPKQTPYLVPPTSAGPRIPRPRGTRLAVGICWAGRPQHANDHNRSLPFELFLDLCDVPGLTLYGLQKGPRVRDIPAHGARALVRDLSPHLHDFADTARFMQQLDLVITVDSAVAHLAGALGRPTILLLPFTPDWRWLGRREDSPWYPTLRLIRQPAPRDWKSVMRQVRDMLFRAPRKD